MLTPISLFSFIAVSRGFHLVNADTQIRVGSWVAVEPDGTGLPSSLSLGWLGAMLPSPPRASNEHRKNNAYKHFLKSPRRKQPFLSS
ncbi:MAG: hypothetical protein QW630_07065 [Sulfolobales archaeon]